MIFQNFFQKNFHVGISCVAFVSLIIMSVPAAAIDSSPVLGYELSVTNNNIVTAAFKPYDQFGDTFTRLEITAG